MRVSEGADTIGVAAVFGDSCELGPIASEAIPLIGAEVSDSVTHIRGAAGTAAAMAGMVSERRGTAVLDPALYRMYHTAEIVDPSKRRKGKAFESDRERRAQAVEWNTAFGHDTGLVQTPTASEEQVDRALNEHRLIEWRTKGEVVAQLMITAARFGVVRIGMVYTAPEHRNRGHAAAFVAAVAQQQLDRQKVDVVALNTQASNASTNRLYQRIGFGSAFEVLTVTVARPPDLGTPALS